MKSFKNLLVAAVGFATVFSMPAASAQTASLNFGTNSPVTCSYTGGVQIGTNGDITIICSAPVSNTGTGTGTGGGTTTYALSVTASPAGAGAFACNGGACTAFASATPMSVVATALTGYTFSNWATGPCAGSASPTCTGFSMPASSLSMTAAFATSGSGGATTPTGVVIGNLPPQGATGNASIFNGVMGVTYAFPLPKTSGGSGLIQLSPEGYPPLIGTNGQWEVSISKTPGDWETAKTMPVQASFGQVLHPYYAAQGGQSGGVSWTYQMDYTGRAIVTTNEQWYFNFRLTNMSGAIYMQW